LFYRLALPFFFIALLFATPAQSAAAQPKLKVVASFSILGDIVREIGGEEVDITTLVGPDRDAHNYQPTPEDAKALAAADIIAINGLKFEGWLGRLIAASGTKAKLLVVSAGVRPRVMSEEEAFGHAHAHAHTHEKQPHEGDVVVDPHAWQDLRNGALYAKNIAAALSAARPKLAAEINERAQTYIAEIKALDREIKTAFAAIPEERRKIITSHDAFGYFGAAYGVTFLSPVGISTEAEPSAADLAALIRQIKAEHVKEVFVENMTSPRLIEQLAKDAGAKLGGTLYADALSAPSGPAPTYLKMMRHNAELMLGAME